MINMIYTKNGFSPLEAIVFRLVRNWMNDRAFAEWLLKRQFGGGSIDHPTTFNEKIQWLKLYNREPLYQELADKYAVRRYVSEKIGELYLNTCYGVYDAPELIEWTRLPHQFVLKVTHGSGMNILVMDRDALNVEKARKQLRKWMQVDYYKKGREWVYRDIKPRILCERLLLHASGGLPADYKVFCFNGIPRYIQVDVDRFSNHTRAFYDTEWIRQEFSLMYPLPRMPISRPERLSEMLFCSQVLSSGIPFVRADFYAIPSLVFGEMTLYPENGFALFTPKEWDVVLGNYLDVPDPGFVAGRPHEGKR